MAAYYNEFDPFAAQWLRELIKRAFTTLKTFTTKEDQNDVASKRPRT